MSSFFPEKVLVGTNSNGTTFRANLWDFSDLAQIQLISFIWSFLAIVFASAIVAPIATLISVLKFNGKILFTEILAIIVGVYFLIDAHNGWIGLLALRVFLNDAVINWLIIMNAASVVISLFLLIFGGFLFPLLMKPVANYGPAQMIPNLPQGIKRRLMVNFIFYIWIIGMLCAVSVTLTSSFIERGWVAKTSSPISTIGQ